mmetsp:Transcript_14075/g.35469  ORF Transcript_14075/g.35469 Transcript_14075/m.35469 type:complete len:214 (-) Transcript_14075:64-705(-)
MDLEALLGRRFHCSVCNLFQHDRLRPAHHPIGGDQHSTLGIQNPSSKRVRRKATEHNGVNGPNSSTRQHCDRQLDHHRQIDGYAIPFPDPHVLQRVGALTHHGVHFLVGKIAAGSVRHVVRFVVKSHLPPLALRDVPVQAVVRHVRAASRKPFRPNRASAAGEIEAWTDGRKWCVPVQLPGDVSEKLLWVGDTLIVHLLVLLDALHMSTRRDS